MFSYRNSIFYVNQYYKNLKGTPGETRGRKAMGLQHYAMIARLQFVYQGCCGILF